MIDYSNSVDGCGNCKYFAYEDVCGEGMCTKLDCCVNCGDEACKLHEDRF